MAQEAEAGAYTMHLPTMEAVAEVEGMEALLLPLLEGLRHHQ